MVSPEIRHRLHHHIFKGLRTRLVARRLFIACSDSNSSIHDYDLTCDFSRRVIVRPKFYSIIHCAKNRIYAIVYFAYISSIRTNIRVRIREISHWYILRIEPISHCVYFEYPQMYHVRYGGFSN